MFTVDNPEILVCFCVVCMNSTQKHNVLSDTLDKDKGELTNVNKAITKTAEEQGEATNVGKTSPKNSPKEYDPYIESFELNNKSFGREEQVFKELEAQKNSADLLKWHQQLNHFP